jgi:hypothetical protein
VPLWIMFQSNNSIYTEHAGIQYWHYSQVILILPKFCHW